MKYIKELVGCVLILLCIIGLDMLNNKYFIEKRKNVEEIIYNLEQKLEHEDYDNNLVNSLANEWYDFEKKAAYYVEHDELEKVSLRIENIKKCVEIEEKNDAMIGLEEIEFLINHIYEKDKLKLKNIF